MEKARNTKQKQAIYRALCSLDHPSATEVYALVRESHPTISRGTVFRVLGGFAAEGKVRRLCLTDSDVRFDPTLTPHAHVRCRICGLVKDVDLPDPLTASAEGFTVEGAEVEFFGVCAACAQAEQRTQKRA